VGRGGEGEERRDKRTFRSRIVRGRGEVGPRGLVMHVSCDGGTVGREFNEGICPLEAQGAWRRKEVGE